AGWRCCTSPRASTRRRRPTASTGPSGGACASASRPSTTCCWLTTPTPTTSPHLRTSCAGLCGPSSDRCGVRCRVASRLRAVILAELEVFHSRAIAPTRRVALGGRDLPVTPAPGFGGILLGGVVAAYVPGLDPD